jgi:hypothetical protein
MPVLKFVSSVKQPEFMKAIRPKPLAPHVMAKLEKYVERQPTLASLGTVPPWRDLFERSGSTDPEGFERQIVATRLQIYVDEWISTGVTADGGEVPLERNLMKAPEATKLLRDYVENHRPTLAFSTKGLEFVFEMFHPGVDDGSLASTRRFDLVSRAFEEAARLFAGLMLSEWGQRLCRCRYIACGRYFLKDRLRRSALVHGTFCCAKHQREASAGECVRTSRANQRQQLIEEAAKILVRWRINSPQWQEDRNRKVKLAFALSQTRLCKRHRFILKPNWVTRHCQPIEERRFELTSN